jgi:hypothetical protein
VYIVYEMVWSATASVSIIAKYVMTSVLHHISVECPGPKLWGCDSNGI